MKNENNVFDLEAYKLRESDGKPRNDGSEPPMTLEPRVEKLEQAVSDIKADVREIRTRLESIDTHFATKYFVAASQIALFLAIAGLLAKGFGWV